MFDKDKYNVFGDRLPSFINKKQDGSFETGRESRRRIRKEKRKLLKRK